jgi:BASS family bile acid:Na+ symporter
MYILALAAGAPFLPKLIQFAKGNIALAVGTMTMLMVGTVIVLPIVLPLVVPGVVINTWEVAKPLVFLMLIPLGIGLTIRIYYEPMAEHAASILNRVTSVSIIILLFLFFVAFWDQIISTFGTGAVGFSIFFVVFALATGYILGGRQPETKRVLGIATANRNIAAGILTATTNFADRPLVSVTVILVSLASLVILMIAAARWGRKGST